MKKRPITVRLDDAIIRRAQALIPVLTTPGLPATLADVYRALIITGLEEIEQQKPPIEGRRRRHPLVRAGAASS